MMSANTVRRVVQGRVSAAQARPTRGRAIRALGSMAALWLALASCAEEPIEYLDVDYQTWERTVAEDLTEVVPGHGAGLRRIYINRTGTDATTDSDGTVRYPDGTVIVKEVYAVPDPRPGEEPLVLTGMVKAPEVSDSRGGWIWVVRNVQSGEETVFAEEYCITCHANANESHPYGDQNASESFRDFVFYPYLREGGN